MNSGLNKFPFDMPYGLHNMKGHKYKHTQTKMRVHNGPQVFSVKEEPLLCSTINIQRTSVIYLLNS